MTPENAVTPTADVTAPPASSESTSAGSSPASQGTSAPTEQPAGSVTADVQGQTDSQPDILADLPSVDELNQQAEQGVKYAKALANLRGALEPLRTQHEELTQRFSPYEAHLERFEQPEQLQSVLDFHDNFLKWGADPETQEPVPATEAFAQDLNQQHRLHADYLVADLLNLPTVDDKGREVPRIDFVLENLAANPAERAKALKILGGVEPGVLAPQWQPTDEELNVIPLNPLAATPEEKALQDLYRTMPYEKREELKLASPEFVRDYLQDQQLKQQLVAERQQAQQAQQRETQQRETYIHQQATQAANEHVSTQLNSALATFHESVVQQCNFIKPLDTAALPQGITVEQAVQLNQQIAASNKSEAAQITGLVVSLFNPETKAYVLPLLKEIGAVDDGLLNKLDAAATSFGNNARNYANISFRQKLTANGTYQPAQDVTQLNNEAQRALKSMVGYANAIKAKLMEKRSQFFELTAQQHNATLNGAQQVRPPLNGQGYNPTTAPAQRQQGGPIWPTRADLERQFG